MFHWLPRRGGVGCEHPRKKIQRQPSLCRAEVRRRGDPLSPQRVPKPPERCAAGAHGQHRAVRWGRWWRQCSQPVWDRRETLPPSLEPKWGCVYTSRTLGAEKGKPGEAVTELRSRIPAQILGTFRATCRKGEKHLSCFCMPTEYPTPRYFIYKHKK